MNLFGLLSKMSVITRSYFIVHDFHLSYSDRIIHPSSHSMTFLWISPSGMSLTTESRDSTVLG